MKIFNIAFIIILFFITPSISSKEIKISGNEFTDEEVIESLIGEIPAIDEKSKLNFILKKLNNSNLFKDVNVSSDENIFYVEVIEYPSLNNVYYQNNKRLKDEDLDSIIAELNVLTLSNSEINNLIDEIKKIYMSFGYNKIEIQSDISYSNNNSGDLFLDFNEGEITKIKKINFKGNTSYDSSILSTTIKSKVKSIRNIFANNNFKIYQINDDLRRIVQFYKSEGYINVKVEHDVEYFKDNSVIINFKINEGSLFYFSSIDIKSYFDDALINSEILNELKENQESIINSNYDRENLNDIEFEISNVLTELGLQFFEIKTYEKINNDQVDVLFEVFPTDPTYIKQINISGNTRTFEYVIRRELDIAEGDPINDSKIKEINTKLNRLSIFSDIEITKKPVDQETQDIDIVVEETQTGSFNVGLSVGTLDGASFVSGLKEKNINGTGRSLEFLINTSDRNKAFTLSTTEKFILNNKIDHKYSTVYQENDYAKSKSYKLNTFQLDTDFSYELSKNLYHTYGVGYHLKDYIVTNSSTVSDSVLKSEGESISFNLKNDLTYNTLNSYIKPTNGNYISLINLLQTPSSSSNGYLKNIISTKKYKQIDKNIYSIQGRIGNIYSLNDSEIISDDKFSLGGKWLRGFDNFGAGPRNSRSSYVGGNNLIATKLDYFRPLTIDNQNPIYLNVFNDYGLVWGNKNTVTSSDQSVRASYGFGINYYSPIGPIGFSWGFPLIDKDYDIKRMFMFTIGNLN